MTPDPLDLLLLCRVAPRTRSLIVTVFGDSLLYRGGGIWLGDLIRLLEPFERAERAVRTAVYRLTLDGTLKAVSRGRRSWYRLTPAGTRRFEAASHRIHACRTLPWDGRWTQVLFSAGIAAADRARVRRELGWLGFAAFSKDMMIHAGGEHPALEPALAEHGIGERSYVLTTAPDRTEEAVERARTLVKETWPLGALDARYRQFVEDFRPLAACLAGETAPSSAFMRRTLLVHAYRRVLLRDPMLPPELLAPGWPGIEAARLVRTAWHGLDAATASHVAANPSPGPAG